MCSSSERSQFSLPLSVHIPVEITVCLYFLCCVLLKKIPGFLQPINVFVQFPFYFFHFVRNVLSLHFTLSLSNICQCILLGDTFAWPSSLPDLVAFQSISFQPYCSKSCVPLNNDVSSRPLHVLCHWLKTCFLFTCCGFCS